MILNEKMLTGFSKFLEYENDDSGISELKDALNSGIKVIKEHLNLNFTYEINTFGAINLHTLVSQYEPITFYIKIYDIQIYENVIKCCKIKSKNKRSKYVTTDSIKLLLSIYLEKYFGEINNVTINRNSVIIDSQSIYGFNARIYVFVSDFENNIMLDTNEQRLLKGNLDEFEMQFNEKANATNYNLIRVVNVVKNLCEKIGVLQYPFLIETLFYNVPNKYYVGDLREQVIKSINYIKFANISKFKSLMNSKENFEKDFLVVTSIYNVYKEYEQFIKSFK
ncbi:MAG: hypothetical protein ACI4TX_03025 [Christensenellales bacterium]